MLRPQRRPHNQRSGDLPTRHSGSTEDLLICLSDFVAIVVAAAATAIAGAFDGSVGQSHNGPLHRREHCPPLLRILLQRFRLTF